MKKIRVLITDDEKELCNMLKDILICHNNQYNIRIACCGEEAVAEIEKNNLDVLITDVRMPGMDGIELMKRARSIVDNIQTIVITAHGDIEYAISALRSGAMNFFLKPVSGEVLHYAVMNAWEKKRGIESKNKYEHALKESEKRYRALFENAGDAIFVNDSNNRILDVNELACELLGYTKDELIGMPLMDIRASKNEAELARRVELLKKSGRLVFESELVSKTGEIIPVEAGSRVVELNEKQLLLTSARDIRGRRKMEAHKANLETQLVQAQKMEAVGMLASGIAHDFNNILTILLGNIEIGIEDVKEKNTENLDYCLKDAKSAILRGRDLIRRIMQFSRQNDTEDHTPVDLTYIIKEVSELLKSTLPSSISIEQEISFRGAVLADASQLHRVITNLCTNAIHAMGDTGGVLKITLKEVEGFDDHPVNVSSRPELKRFAEITVSDTGQGIKNEILDKIFNPYFTTKGKKVGTGLGLTVVHGIVRSHKGTVSVKSEPGKGAEFRVLLPVPEFTAHDNQKTRDAIEKYEGNEHILVVDDENRIADILKKLLEKLGYSVTRTNSGVDALKQFTRSPEIFDLIITDMDMPEITGMALSREILRIRPEMPIILCTGYGDLISEEKAREKGISKLMVKPLLKTEVASTVRDVLNISSNTPEMRFPMSN